MNGRVRLHYGGSDEEAAVSSGANRHRKLGNRSGAFEPRVLLAHFRGSLPERDFDVEPVALRASSDDPDDGLLAAQLRSDSRIDVQTEDGKATGEDESVFVPSPICTKALSRQQKTAPSTRRAQVFVKSALM
jgi:hypothetical protein